MTDNLNRIKRILSAQLGAEIPKFLKGYTIYHKSNNLPLYSPDGNSWFTDENYSNPFNGNINDYTEPELKLLFYTKNSNVTIPELNNTTSSNILNSNIISNTLNNILSTQNSNKPYNLISNPVVGINGVTNLANNLGLSVPGENKNINDPTSAIKSAANTNHHVQELIEQRKSNEIASENIERLPSRSVDKIVNDPIKTNTYKPTYREIKSVVSEINDPEVDAYNAKLQQKYSNIANTGSAVLQTVGNAFGAQQMATDSDLTKGADLVYNGIAGAVEQMGPYGKIIGTAMKAAGAAGNIIQSMGGGTDQQTKMDKWMDSSFFSWNIGMINGFAGKNSDSFGADQETLAAVGSSYGGTANSINEAAKSADKKYGLFSSKARKKANANIEKVNSQQSTMADIADQATDLRLAVQSMGEQAGLAYSLMTDGGYNQKYTYAAKEGGILDWNPNISLEWEPRIELNWELPVFKEGGSLDNIPEIEKTTQKNVIPEGALHKNKHHMEHAEGLTKKGIPVIDEEGEQQAEIEHSEIIFTLEVTKKLEEYYQIFYSEESSNKEKEQAALDAGKLLVYQILENTEDRTGLIDSCKQGGILTLKKSTDDLIEELFDWEPTIVIVEEKEVKEQSKNKSDKEDIKKLIKEALIELLTT